MAVGTNGQMHWAASAVMILHTRSRLKDEKSRTLPRARTCRSDQEPDSETTEIAQQKRSDNAPAGISYAGSKGSIENLVSSHVLLMQYD